MQRIVKQLIVAAATALLVVPPTGVAVAAGADPGRWSGRLLTLGGNQIGGGAKVTFTVKGSKVNGFVAENAPVNCVDAFNPAGSKVEFRTISVPTTRIKGKRFSRVYNVVPSGKITLNGRFKKPNKATGTLEYNSGACVGDYRFTAKR